MSGVVYLIHFHEKLAHAQHYFGFCAGKLSQRLEEHFAGRGARITAVCVERGIGFECVRVWHKQTRSDERWFKNQRKSKQFCPLCAKRIRCPRKRGAN